MLVHAQLQFGNARMSLNRRAALVLAAAGSRRAATDCSLHVQKSWGRQTDWQSHRRQNAAASTAGGSERCANAAAAASLGAVRPRTPAPHQPCPVVLQRTAAAAMALTLGGQGSAPRRRRLLDLPGEIHSLIADQLEAPGDRWAA